MSPSADPTWLSPERALRAAPCEAQRAAVLAAGAVLALRALRALRRHRDAGRLSAAEYDAAVASLTGGDPPTHR